MVVWHRILDLDELSDGRVTVVTVENRSFAITKFEGVYAALDNRCPHQGGPLGEGSIEQGWLRCPWHGWDFHPTTGKPPGGYDDGVCTFPIEERTDGVYLGLRPTPKPARTVSDVMIETMVNWGVTHVFGMVGHSNLGVADAMRRQQEQGRLTFIGIRHEGAASFAASAYAKLTGKPAACFAIAGPGATNLLTGLWDAKVDRAPILALTGQVDTQVLGPGAFQEVDLSQAFQGVAVWSQTVLATSRHAELMNLALKNAILKRDVAHLIFPNEVQQIAAEDVSASDPKGRITPLTIRPPEPAFEDALQALAHAKRPVTIVGHGTRFDMDGVMTLAERLNAPVITTFKGKGLVSDHHPLGCGVLGRSGTPIASWFMNEADLLMVFGASFSNHTGITPKKPIIQVDYDPMALGKFHKVAYPIWGEIGETAKLFADRLTNKETVDQRGEVADRWSIWRREKLRRAGDDRGKGLNSAFLFAQLTEAVNADAVIAVDVGNNTYSFGRYFECDAQSVLMSGYLGSIGFGLPAAMGAWCASPNRQIVSISGDGGFGQYMAELTTAVKYGMNITHVLLNNGELGKISKEQRADQLDVWQTQLHNPNFASYAENCGALGIRVQNRSELKSALRRALDHHGPALVEVITDAMLI
ncbi:MAG: Rieske 2Fe-2S domain-containing protein [Acidobacteria bacterium]|nr:Rieske 2Fe-2S domain-containing protein [Acidobacteriota bacterium]